MSDQSNPPDPSGVSRRGFLKGISVTTMATGLLSPAGVQEAAAKEGDLVGPGEMEVTLNINGTRRKVSIEPRVMLLDALRNRLDLTGAKKVCDRGTCGACTVLVDDQPVYACSTLAIETIGKKITTIEGIGTPEELSPVQKAFVENDGQQCGFCTPGFVMACTSFVKDHPKASAEEIRSGLGGNLCRCGTYAGILAAMAETTGAKKGGE